MGLEESPEVVPHVCQECVDRHRQIDTVCPSILFLRAEPPGLMP